MGEALRELFESGEASREELIICSKGGFIPLCYPFPKNPYVWIEENILKSKLASKEEIELDQHCMSPDFLEYSCRGSLERLGVDALDIYFLHNPEMQLKRLGKEAFYEAIEKIFERFESLRAQGLFHYYGVATWNAFLLDETH
ncbi:MAG: aldo/keto reductase [Sulfurovaceae bacterium]